MTHRKHQWRAWRRSLALSAIIHSLPSLVLLLCLPAVSRDDLSTAGSIQTYVAESTFDSHWTLRPDVSLEELDQVAEERPAASPEVPGNTAILPDFVRKQLRKEMQSAEDQSPEDLRARLEKLGGQLQSESSEKSVKAIANLIGTNRELPAAGASVTGEFDHATAQIDRVDKSVADDGQLTYVATLVDSQGREQQVEMSPEDGAQLYETFELMKRFPLLESIYRQVVMGMLDKMLADPTDTPPPVTAPNEPVSESGAVKPE